MNKLQLYTFKFFFQNFIATLFAINSIVLLFNATFEEFANFNEFLLISARTIVFSLELSIPISFIVAFCIFKIKFWKNLELLAIKSMGISNFKILKPIIYFSFLCGVTIYCNQSIFAPLLNANLVRNYTNLSKNWKIKQNQLINLKQKATQNKFEPQEITIFSLDKEKNLTKIENYSKSTQAKSYQIDKNSIIIDKLEKPMPKISFKESIKQNFFYLSLTELFPLAFLDPKKKLFQYIFFQKIVDIFSVFLILLILLGKQPDPRNGNLETILISEIILTIAFLFTNQLSFFIFEYGLLNPFFAAFGNSMLWITGLIIRQIILKK